VKYDPNKNAKVIVPLAIAAWLGGVLVFTAGVPVAAQVLFVVAFAVAVPTAVCYLIGEAGWRALAKRHRATVPFDGKWTLCPTGQMALVNVDHPDFHRVKMRFVGGSLSVGTTPAALYLLTMFSRLPVLSWFFPTLQIPWTTVSTAHAFEAPGWFTPLVEPGTVLQVAYDPNYTGKFIEIEVGTPPVFIQLPAEILGEDIRRLPGLVASAG